VGVLPSLAGGSSISHDHKTDESVVFQSVVRCRGGCQRKQQGALTTVGPPQGQIVSVGWVSRLLQSTAKLQATFLCVLRPGCSPHSIHSLYYTNITNTRAPLSCTESSSWQLFHAWSLGAAIFAACAGGVMEDVAPRTAAYGNCSCPAASAAVLPAAVAAHAWHIGTRSVVSNTSL
jgi:nitrate reductase cytochrome c-type subunit